MRASDRSGLRGATAFIGLLALCVPIVAAAQPAPEGAPAAEADAGAPLATPPEPPRAAPEVAAQPKPAPEPPPVAAPAPLLAPAAASPPRLPTGFSFGSYGRMVASTDAKGRPGRDADIVAHGSRLDESSYVELELRRDDTWEKTGARTRVVATLAVAGPFFHQNGDFAINMGVRNLYLEERDLIAKGLSVWVGSRMYRGDDVYLLDFWPLDNLNTLGGGIKYDVDARTSAAVHLGLSQPNSLFFHQSVDRPAPLNQFGTAKVAVLDRQRSTASFRLQHLVPIGERAGLKGVAYAEVHHLPSGQLETDPGRYQDLPGDQGYVIGAQIGAFTGARDTHLNLFLRYARGIAAYGDFSSFSTTGSTYGGATGQITPELTTAGAHELLVAAGGNWEAGPVGLMLGAYMRSFRNASPGLDFEDVDEGIVIVRPHVFFGEVGGLAVEGAYEAAQRGVLAPSADVTAAGQTAKGPLAAHVGRLGFVPFLSPAGRGDYSRPQIRLIWSMTFRDAGARALYPVDDVFGLRSVEHFLGIGAEWWFNSSSYGG